MGSHPVCLRGAEVVETVEPAVDDVGADVDDVGPDVDV